MYRCEGEGVVGGGREREEGGGRGRELNTTMDIVIVRD